MPLAREITKLYAWFAKEGRERLRVNLGPAIDNFDFRPTALEAWVRKQNWPALGASA